MQQHSSHNFLTRALAGFGWSFVGTATQSLLHLAILIVLARSLSPLDFGIVGTVLLMVTLTKVICRLGISQAIVQRQDLRQGHIGAGFAICMALGALGAIVLGTTTAILAFQSEQIALAKVLFWLAPIPLAFGFGAIPEGLLQRNLRFKSMAQADVASYSVGYGIIGITLAISGAGIWSLLAAYWAQVLIRTTMLYQMCNTPLIQGFSRQDAKELLDHGSGQTLAAVFNYGAMEGDKLAVTSTLGMATLGLYGRAYQLAVLPAATLGMIVEKVAFPTFSQQQKNQPLLRDTYAKGITLLLSISIPFITYEILAASEIIQLVLGQKWMAVVPLFQVLALSGFFRAGYRFCESFARANGAVYQRAWRHGVYGLLVISLAFAGSTYGVLGIASGVVTAIAIHYFLVTQLSLKILEIRSNAFLRIHAIGLFTGGANAAMIATLSLLLRNANASAPVYLTLLTLVSVALIARLLAKEFLTLKRDQPSASQQAMAA